MSYQRREIPHQSRKTKAKRVIEQAKDPWPAQFSESAVNKRIRDNACSDAPIDLFCLEDDALVPN